MAEMSQHMLQVLDLDYMDYVTDVKSTQAMGIFLLRLQGFMTMIILRPSTTLLCATPHYYTTTLLHHRLHHHPATLATPSPLTCSHLHSPPPYSSPSSHLLLSILEHIPHARGTLPIGKYYQGEALKLRA